MSSSLEEAISARTYAHPLRWWLSRQTFWVSLAVAIACGALTLATDTFATERNLFNVTRNFAFVGIIALGMTVVIITRGIDLSVGSSVVLAAIVTGLVMSAGYSSRLKSAACS
jgi:ribose transport system permease protein